VIGVTFGLVAWVDYGFEVAVFIADGDGPLCYGDGSFVGLFFFIISIFGIVRLFFIDIQQTALGNVYIPSKGDASILGELT
jgi:hypothetical protein